jgi:nucleotide-binding universal stress UspA family protein
MYDTILVAVDGSKLANKAVDAAANIARCFNSSVVAVTAREQIRAHGELVPAHLDDEEQDVAHEAARKLKDQGIEATSVSLEATYAHVGKLIVDQAKEVDAGLIVMGSRGHGEISSLLIGSVAHKVLHLTDIPVLVVR